MIGLRKLFMVGMSLISSIRIVISRFSSISCRFLFSVV